MFVHVVHKFIDERYGDLFHLGFGVWHFANKYIACGVYLFFGSIILLVFLLVYLRIEPLAPFYAMIFLFFCAMLRKSTRYTRKTFIAFLFETGKLVSQITAILAGVGLIVGAMSGTGTANSFSRELVLMAGDNVVFLLIFGAMTSFILGIGMTATAWRHPLSVGEVHTARHCRERLTVSLQRMIRRAHHHPRSGRVKPG